ncbi:hypothetical protein F2P56_004010 [Juglans regia]|uniref:Uncharacterized protein LOC108998012 isoform X1 n=2 Tax=Juglans regia TaxID=51240 RepID=A0A2I4FEA7_JUGRE|nr:uncharacterized protein LOC108998012 isoform X1 [Juglans regia]XP_018829978.1 uncharacterized protein LOC108998012 isoform X1 [Juglans regia]KAF5477361.1 hypothetical protein F2P56_004010 [Juglans regia]
MSVPGLHSFSAASVSISAAASFWRASRHFVPSIYRRCSLSFLNLFICDELCTCVKFTGTNYSTWVFQFELFLKGKDLWSHIDGTNVAPKSTTEKSKDLETSPSWVVLDAKILSLLLRSMEPHIVTNLRAHRSAQSMWNYLKKVYHQANDARRFQLEHAIAIFQHGSISIQDYYLALFTLWHEYTDFVTMDVLVAALSTIQTLHETSRRDQFLKKLCLEFEFVRSLS